MNLKVSVIIPTYNRVHLLGQALDSVLSQSYQNWECIVVDDGSTDYTEELMLFYLVDPRIKFLKREKLPKGASHCRNIGLKAAEGEFCIFLDSDDMLLPHCLMNRLQLAKDYSDKYFFVFPMYTQHKGQREILKIPEDKDYLIEFLKYRIHWQTMCTLWDTKFARSIGGFNEAYPRLNDPEIHIRAMLIAGNNYMIFNQLQPDTVYRIEEDPRNKKDFALKYYESLTLFAVEIPRFLKKYNHQDKISYLKEYLNDYLKQSFSFIKRKRNLRLFKVFYTNNIIGLGDYLKLSSNYLKFLASNKGFLGDVKKYKLRLY